MKATETSSAFKFFVGLAGFLALIALPSTLIGFGGAVFHAIAAKDGEPLYDWAGWAIVIGLVCSLACMPGYFMLKRQKARDRKEMARVLTEKEREAEAERNRQQAAEEAEIQRLMDEMRRQRGGS